MYKFGGVSYKDFKCSGICLSEGEKDSLLKYCFFKKLYSTDKMNFFHSASLLFWIYAILWYGIYNLYDIFTFEKKIIMLFCLFLHFDKMASE